MYFHNKLTRFFQKSGVCMDILLFKTHAHAYIKHVHLCINACVYKKFDMIILYHFDLYWDSNYTKLTALE